MYEASFHNLQGLDVLPWQSQLSALCMADWCLLPGRGLACCTTDHFWCVLTRNTKLLCWILWSSEATVQLPRKCLLTLMKIKGQVAKTGWYQNKTYRRAWESKVGISTTPAPEILCKTRKDFSFSFRSHVLLTEWCPWVWFHHSDFYCLGYQLHGCAGVRDQQERVFQPPMLESACCAGVRGLGRGFELEVKPATDEVELTFVIEEKAPSL